MRFLQFPKTAKAIRWVTIAGYLSVIIYVAVLGLVIGVPRIQTFPANIDDPAGKEVFEISGFWSDPDLLSRQGFALLQAKKSREAGQSFSRALRIKPHSYPLWIKLGDAYENLGEFASAETAYLKALELAPNYNQPRWRLGELYLLQNNPQPAFVYFNEAADIDPGLFRTVIFAASRTFSGDPVRIQQFVRPGSLAGKKELALFFLENNIH